MWHALYPRGHQPTLDEIARYIHNPLWEAFQAFIEETYALSPKTDYVSSPTQEGWSLQYKKSGKSLCTLYPMDGFFIIQIVIGMREAAETAQALFSCCPYTQAVFKKTPDKMGGKWLTLEVRTEEILTDVRRLIQIRMKPKRTPRKA